MPSVHERNRESRKCVPAGRRKESARPDVRRDAPIILSPAMFTGPERSQVSFEAAHVDTSVHQSRGAGWSCQGGARDIAGTSGSRRHTQGAMAGWPPDCAHAGVPENI